MIARRHEVKSVDVIEKTHIDWLDSDIYEIWKRKHRPITVIGWFAVLHISPLNIMSINVLSIRFYLVH